MLKLGLKQYARRNAFPCNCCVGCNGSLMAQLGAPDMRIPIQVALTWPDRLPLDQVLEADAEARRLTASLIK